MRPSAIICSRLFLLFLFSTPTACFAWLAKVTSISDGDTITVLHSGRHEKIRLHGIDTPEKNQDYGQKAKELTNTLIAGRKVEVETKDVDQYGRTIGLVSVDGHSINELLIMNGFAWVYRQYCKEHFCYDWIQLEEKARRERKGLWAGSTIVPPWDWRHQPQETKKDADETPTIIMGKQAQSVNNYGSGSSFRCDGRTHCSQMTSCEEATFFLKNCPSMKMDGDNDGVPCEKQWCH